MNAEEPEMGHRARQVAPRFGKQLSVQSGSTVALQVAAQQQSWQNDGSLPPGWEEVCIPGSAGADGRPQRFYIDHNTQSTTWVDPRDIFVKPLTFEDCVGDELPFGWEESLDKDVGQYFIDHNSRTTQLEDPRSTMLEEQKELLQSFLSETEGTMKQRKKKMCSAEKSLRRAQDRVNRLAHYAGDSQSSWEAPPSSSAAAAAPDAAGATATGGAVLPPYSLDPPGHVEGTETKEDRERKAANENAAMAIGLEELQASRLEAEKAKAEVSRLQEEIAKGEDGLQVLGGIKDRLASSSYTLDDARATVATLESLSAGVKEQMAEKARLEHALSLQHARLDSSFVAAATRSADAAVEGEEEAPAADAKTFAPQILMATATPPTETAMAESASRRSTACSEHGFQPIEQVKPRLLKSPAKRPSLLKRASSQDIAAAMVAQAVEPRQPHQQGNAPATVAEEAAAGTEGLEASLERGRAYLDQLSNAFQHNPESATVSRTRIDLELELAATLKHKKQVDADVEALRTLSEELTRAENEVLRVAQAQAKAKAAKAKAAAAAAAEATTATGTTPNDTSTATADMGRPSGSASPKPHEHRRVLQLQPVLQPLSPLSGEAHAVDAPSAAGVRYVRAHGSISSTGSGEDSNKIWILEEKVQQLLRTKEDAVRRVNQIREQSEAAATRLRTTRSADAPMTFRAKMEFFTSSPEEWSRHQSGGAAVLATTAEDGTAPTDAKYEQSTC